MMRLGTMLSAFSLAAWLGAAIIFAAVVAPAAFAVLPARALAGAIVGKVLPVLFVAGILVAAVTLAFDRGLPALVTARRVAAILIALACGAAQFGIGPRIDRLRREMGPSIEALADTDPRRAQFGRLHGVSVAFLGVAMLAAGASLAMFAIAAREGSDG